MFDQDQLKADLRSTAQGISRAVDELLVDALKIALVLTIPAVGFIRFVPSVRQFIGMFGETALMRADQATWWACIITGGLLLGVSRRFWWPLLALTVLTLLRLVGTVAAGGWRLLRGGRATSADRESTRPAPLVAGPASVTSRRPPVDLLGPPTRVEVSPCPEVAQAVRKALTALGIQNCEVVSHYAGPVVSVVQMRPPEGVKASAVQRLAADLAAMLGTKSVSIEPVVGSPGVLEFILTSDKEARVPLRALVESEEYRRIEILPLIVGFAALGHPLVADLTKLPHLLVAGATNMGKSVAINQMILGLLLRLDPSELRLLLIDPKRVEFSAYRGLPHLLQEVLTEPAAAIAALEKLVGEMERRYRLLEELGVRNLADYNRANPRSRLPYIVAIIDEFADLIMVAKDGGLEDIIQRLAQKARAAGIHVILATQTPRKEVITGLIKANIPAQVALAVANHVDSRVILDEGGAEQLRGKGDLLFRAGGRTLRGQGAWVPDEMVRAVVGWWQRPDAPAVHRQPPEEAPPQAPGAQPKPVGASSGDPDDEPALTREQQELVEVARMALEYGEAGRRDVERRLGIGSARANAILQTLEERGWLTPPHGPKPRRCAYSPERRRQMLAEIQGIRPEAVVLRDEEPPTEDRASGSPEPISVDPEPSPLLAELEESERRVRGAIRVRNWLAVEAFMVDVDRIGAAARQSGHEEILSRIGALRDLVEKARFQKEEGAS